jgi:hypothetical protein
LKVTPSSDLLLERERTWIGNVSHKTRALKILMASRINSTDGFVSNFTFDFKLLNGKPICATGMRKLVGGGHSAWYRCLNQVKSAMQDKVDLRANNPDVQSLEKLKYGLQHGVNRVITATLVVEVAAWLRGYGDANGDWMPDKSEVRVPFFLYQVNVNFSFFVLKYH